MLTNPPVPAGLGRIGPWRVIRRLGRGGVASVYEVVEPELGRRLALKLYRDPSAAGGLEREYRALAGLDHPGIVRVLGRGDHEGARYLLMELVLGRPAQGCARHAGVPGTAERTAVSLRVVHDLLEALAYLHRRGIVHRDIKSSNVLADASGQVKLLDLGTAGYERRDTARGGAWVPGLERFAGTVAYASPEQLRGLDLDGRSDLFSVGVLCYRMLTGELPFVATGREQAVVVREHGAPAAPHARVPGIAGDLGSLVMELLAHDPGDRPADAEQVLRRLRPLLVGGGPRHGGLWPPPPPIFGRRQLLEELESFVAGHAAGSLRILQGAPGLGVPELLGWVGQQARRSGSWVLQVSAVGGEPGNLISRLLLAVPRHVRRGLRGPAQLGARAAQRVARAVELLARLDRASDRALLLTLPALQRAEPSELAELLELMLLVERRGLRVRAIGGWEHPDPMPVLTPELARSVPHHLRLEPLSSGAATWLLRSQVAGRVLPPSLQASLLRDHGGHPAELVQALQGLVAAGRLRLGRSPEGTACWLDTLAGLDEPVSRDAKRLADLLSAPVDGPPWARAHPPAPQAYGIALADLLASAPEDHPEPRVRGVLHAWRGHARSLRGDRDLQADADLLQAEEELRIAERAGWEAGTGWLEYVALVRSAHLSARGRQLESSRRLLDAPRAVDAPWQQEHRLASLLLLATAEGHTEVPELPPPERTASAGEGEPDDLAVVSAQATWLLQRGCLRTLSEPCWSGRAVSDAWSAEPYARLVVARAGAARLRGELSGAVAMLAAALVEVELWGTAPPRVSLLLALAELELELFRPGVSREHLADCFVLLRHCDRPELSAGRERIRGRVALACGEPGRAEEAFRTGLNMLRGTGFHVQAAELQCQLARALARLGRRREASSLVPPARELLAKAGALPGLASACSAAWEAGGYRDEPQLAWAPVLRWLDEQAPLLIRCDLALARLRHAAMHHELDRVHALRRESAALLRQLLSAQSTEDRAILALHPRMRLLRQEGDQSSTGAGASASSILA